MYNDLAYAPFGEIYANTFNTGATNVSFAGNHQDTVENLYDAAMREYEIYGRWPSPDPAGLRAVNPSDPQTWNRYGYVRNNPLLLRDVSGTRGCYTVQAMPADNSQQTSGSGPYDPEDAYAPPQQAGCGGFDSPFGGGSGEDVIGIDGGFGPASLAGGAGEEQCPDNVCSGFAQDSNGDWKWVQFNSFEGGVSGYFYGPDLSNGINIFDGQIYSDANYQLKLEQVYASQIASQCGTVSANLSADAPPNSGANVGSCSALYIQGSHANFQVNCGTWNGGDCTGRWPGGLHIEGKPSEGFWGHNDTASYYIGSQFNWETFSPWNLFVHGIVDVVYGSAFTYMFPH